MFLFVIDARTFVEGLVRVNRCPNQKKHFLFKFQSLQADYRTDFCCVLGWFSFKHCLFPGGSTLFFCFGGDGGLGEGGEICWGPKPNISKTCPVSGLVFPAVSGFQSHAGRPHCNEPCQRGQCDWRLFLLHRCRISQGDPNPKSEVIFPFWSLTVRPLKIGRAPKGE